MYTVTDFKTKKALKEAVKRVPLVLDRFGYTSDGMIFVEGPHHPKPHTWYAQCLASDGHVVKVVK